MAVSKKVIERIVTGLKRYQTILTEAKRRDISESDTVVIVGDMLADILGYKKYVDITTEFAIRGTFVDLAIKVGEEVRFLIEVKAIGVDLKDAHVKQAIDYGANQGIEWVLLTNGINWRAYKITFQQPIDKTLVFDIDLASANPRSEEVTDCFGNLSREGFTQSSMVALLQQRQATSKFSIASIMVGDPVIGAVRKELKRLYPSVRTDIDAVRFVVENEVLKRELVEGDEAKLAQQSLKKAAKAAERARAKVETRVESSVGIETASVSVEEAVAQS